MDDVIFSGHITEEKFQDERPLQMESLSKEEYKALITEPQSKWKQRLLVIAGSVFLIIGFVLLTLILVGTLS
jgi:hypothetical protein